MVLALRWVFCTDLRTDSDLCFIRHYVTDFYNRRGKCLHTDLRTDSLYKEDYLVIEQLTLTEVFP